MARHGRHAQVALHGGQCAGEPLLGIQLLHCFEPVGALLHRILDGNVEQVLLVATLGNVASEAGKFHVGHDIDDGFGDSFTLIGVGKPLMHLGNGHRHDLGIGLVTCREAVLEGERLYHCPTPHVHEVDPCGIIIA